MEVEAACEAFRTGEADPGELHRVAVQHLHARLRQDLRDLHLLAGFVVVVAQHADHRHPRPDQFAGQHVRLLREAVIGQVTAQRDDVRLLAGSREELT